MAKNNKPKAGEPYMLALSVNDEEVMLPLVYEEALKLYTALSYYIQINSTKEQTFLN